MIAGMVLFAFSVKELVGLDVGVEVIDSHSLDRRDFGSIFLLFCIGVGVVGWSFFQIQYAYIDIKERSDQSPGNE